MKLFIIKILTLISILASIAMSLSCFYIIGKSHQMQKDIEIINIQNQIIQKADKVFESAYIIEYKDSSNTVEKYIYLKSNLQKQLDN